MRRLEAPATPAGEAVPFVKAAFLGDGRGGGTLQLRYSGSLLAHEVVWVRLGERRDGEDWLDPRDVRMERSDGQAIARVHFAPGEPVEGACCAFFAFARGQEEPVWDNAGRPFGCYVVDAQTGVVRACLPE